MNTKRILIVDDEESLRFTLAANLELEGFTVIEAESGSHALEILKAESVDLVLSDIRMPGMSGVELFLELKKTIPEIPVLLMTAFSADETIQKAIHAGVFAVVYKPFDIDKILAVLRRALKRPVVLVVDDMETVATTTAEALRAVGVRAEVSFDGNSATEMVRKRSIDVCITDLSMLDMSGVELTRWLTSEAPSVCVIAFSGASNNEQLMREAVAAGASRCLRKPVAPSVLVAAIARARGLQN